MPLPAIERFIEKVAVDPVSGCWRWTGSLNNRGYGQFYYEGSLRYAHRWAYAHFVGPIPEGLVIDHLCRLSACANPRHLEPVTQAENIRRGDSPASIAARSGTCTKGDHDRSDPLLVYRGNGSIDRRCRECQRAYRAAWSARRKEALA